MPRPARPKRDRKETKAVSIANLRAMPPLHGEKKMKRNLTITPTAWEILQKLANDIGAGSVSELNEGIGRGKYKISISG